MKVTIHQPEHLPWLGFFHKLSQADTFAVLDNVPFRKNYFQNRNKILTHQGWSWVTVPVSRGIDTLIKDVRVFSDGRWKRKWWDSIYFSYRKTEYFNRYADGLRGIIYKDFAYLCDLNIELIKLLCGFLDVDVRLVRASSLDAKGIRGDLLLDCCKKLGADTYVSGVSGKDYLDECHFSKEGITVAYQKFYHPIYKQQYEPFEPCMGAIDLIFNYGPASKSVLMGKGVEVMDKVFL